jgi:putative DNA primase/helicase
MQCTSPGWTTPARSWLTAVCTEIKVEGDHARNSWYVLHSGPPMAAVHWLLETILSETWCARKWIHERSATGSECGSSGSKLSSSAKRPSRSVNDKARSVAAWILNRSTPATDAHQYLANKLIMPVGDLRQSGGKLIVALRDSEGMLHSTQSIEPGGKKRFLDGGRVAGCFFTIDGDPAGPIVIAEGYATAASIHMGTNYTTIAAMNSGNLLSVATAIRAKHPEADLVIAGDNDAQTEGNPGATAAATAAKAVGARLVIAMAASWKADFNDVHAEQGTRCCSRCDRRRHDREGNGQGNDRPARQT